MGNYQIQFSSTEILFYVYVFISNISFTVSARNQMGAWNFALLLIEKSSKLNIVTHSRALITKGQRTLSKSRTLALGVLGQCT